MKKSRFLAGAKCPKCGALDTIVISHNELSDKIECIQCGFLQLKEEQTPILEIPIKNI